VILSQQTNIISLCFSKQLYLFMYCCHLDCSLETPMLPISFSLLVLVVSFHCSISKQLIHSSIQKPLYTFITSIKHTHKHSFTEHFSYLSLSLIMSSTATRNFNDCFGIPSSPLPAFHTAEDRQYANYIDRLFEDTDIHSFDFRNPFETLEITPLKEEQQLNI